LTCSAGCDQHSTACMTRKTIASTISRADVKESRRQKRCSLNRGQSPAAPMCRAWHDIASVNEDKTLCDRQRDVARSRLMHCGCYTARQRRARTTLPAQHLVKRF